MIDDSVLLTAATLVICVNLAQPLFLPRLPISLRALWGLSTLAAATVLVAFVFGSPLRPRFGAAAEGWSLAWQQAVEVGWWVAAARSLAGVFRLLLTLHNRSRETQILSDLISAAVYLATVLAIVDIVFAVPVGGLIATSGIIAVVIGLALQSTLSDVFSGIAIDIERPYRAGDHVSLEGGIEGRVREVNWRSTHVATGHGDVAVVPNSIMAKARLVNHNRPGPERRASVEVRLDPRVMPERCRAALDAAIQSCRLPATDPAPSVAQIELRGDGAIYEISFSVTDSGSLGPARTEMLAQVQRHLIHAAIPLAVDGLAEVPRLTPPTADELLAATELFGIMAPAERDLLASSLEPLHLAPGESLFAQGDAAGALFVVASGTVALLRRNPDGSEITHRASPGATLGAISLIMEQPYGASSHALTAIKVFRLDKAALAAVLTESPRLVSALEDWAQRSIAAIRADFAAEPAASERSDQFLLRMRGFLRKLAGGVGQGMSR